MRPQLNGHQPFAQFAEPDHRIERRVQMQVRRLAFRQNLPHRVVHPRERTVQAEGHGLVRHQVQILAVQFHSGSFFRAARDQANRLILPHAYVVRPRQPAPDEKPRAGRPHIRVIRRAHRHSQIQIVVPQHDGTLFEPPLQHIRDALLAQFGNEEPAVEQNSVRPSMVVGVQEGRQMPRDRRVGNIGQTQLPEQAALLFLGLLIDPAKRQESIERQFQRLFAQDLGFQRSADQGRPAAQHRDLHLLQIRIRQQALFGGRALPPQTASLPDGKLRPQL